MTRWMTAPRRPGLTTVSLGEPALPSRCSSQRSRGRRRNRRRRRGRHTDMLGRRCGRCRPRPMSVLPAVYWMGWRSAAPPGLSGGRWMPSRRSMPSRRPMMRASAETVLVGLPGPMTRANLYMCPRAGKSGQLRVDCRGRAPACRMLLRLIVTRTPKRKLSTGRTRRCFAARKPQFSG